MTNKWITKGVKISENLGEVFIAEVYKGYMEKIVWEYNNIEEVFQYLLVRNIFEIITRTQLTYLKIVYVGKM